MTLANDHLDGSYWQGPNPSEPAPDWPVVLERSPIRYVHWRAGVGSNYVDSTYTINREAAMHNEYAQMYWGAYHAWYPTHDPQAQINRFVGMIGTPGVDFDLWPCLDIERWWSGLTKAYTRPRIRDYCLAALAEWPRILIYTSRYLWDDVLVGAGQGWVDPDRMYLFVAHYGVEVPLLPADWVEAGYVLHQYTQSARVPGIRNGVGYVDRSRRRTDAELRVVPSEPTVEERLSALEALAHTH